MSQDTAKPKSWIKPEVKRLGVIDDVAGAQTPLAQTPGTSKS